MKPLRRALFLFRRMLWPCSCVVLSYHYDLIAASVTLVTPWVLFSVGIVGIVSRLWSLSVGPAPFDYERAFVLYDRLSPGILAALYLRLLIHGFWMLQALNFLVDVYPTPAQSHHKDQEPVRKQRRAC